MKICKKSQTLTHHNNEHCSIVEYPIDMLAINMALATISGRYPSSGYAINHIVQEMAYIQQGSGSICVNGETTDLEEGDVVLVEPGDKFFWEGDFKAIIACSPAFSPEQHEICESD